PACPQTYTAAPGDSWYRIADEAGVTPSRLLTENRATTDTAILPGDDICLPEGAAMPRPPVTATPAPAAAAPTPTTPPPTPPAPAADAPTPTTAAPTTAAPTTAPPTTAPPTTAPPTTAPPTTAPAANLSRDQVQELIRQTWPADQVDKALDVARRESNFIATA